MALAKGLVEDAEGNFHDVSSETGANLLARKIEAYWRDRGYPGVTCRIEKTRRSHYCEYAVRSNLMRGLPPELAYKGAG